MIITVLLQSKNIEILYTVKSFVLIKIYNKNYIELFLLILI